jgi:hypothetical protein
MRAPRPTGPEQSAADAAAGFTIATTAGNSVDFVLIEFFNPNVFVAHGLLPYGSG